MVAWIVREGPIASPLPRTSALVALFSPFRELRVELRGSGSLYNTVRQNTRKMTQCVTTGRSLPIAGADMARRIKRYDNRKLYDTESSEYVSLDDIAELVRSGETVEVVDNASGEDLTAQTLTQIILEEGKDGRQVIPSDLLHQLLRRSGEVFDMGIDQIRSTVDGLLQSSLGRLQRLVQGPRAEELNELRSQLRQLEHRLSILLDDLDDRPQDIDPDTGDSQDVDPSPEEAFPTSS
jgi:polyhydroxyalkanoate synthesis repressor PhaR